MLEVINGAVVTLVLKVPGAGLTFLFNLVLTRALVVEGARRGLEKLDLLVVEKWLNSIKEISYMKTRCCSTE